VFAVKGYIKDTSDTPQDRDRLAEDRRLKIRENWAVVTTGDRQNPLADKAKNENRLQTQAV
jgi:hypothetical protein